ncbi:hypothetical protein B0920_16730 [Massilia sp. KIM]|uniref:DUF4256 domain-containing protein n=1 Tax=Massilia sp. KIM TaxID=1955422 RepID=UPI00098F40FD|nr:DUF4256 domain-containing protein [Massilia sp. KIM]OON60619.1 hypothetical protein B0920_16730 [Massilia sp. KIM]
MNSKEHDILLDTLRARFETHMHRHESLSWTEVRERLKSKPEALRALHAMEESGGEPDVIGKDENGRIAFCDCSPETPLGRRSLCYDEAALAARKENKPQGSALGMAAAMGVELLTEEQYRALQQLGEFDLKTSSWIATPPEVRKLGGALFCDRRYGKVFTYHNGVQSYYAVRGFRAVLTV